MGKFKQFKTYIRKKIGMVGVAEFVDDAVAANTDKNWNNWFSNPKYLKEYADKGRLQTYVEIVDIFEKQNVFKNVKSLLDAGCGTGHLLVEIYKRYKDIKLFGGDFSSESIKVSQNNLPQGSFFELDLYKISNNQANKYDIVVCSEVLEHLLYPEIALNNLKSYVNDNGKLLLTVPNGRLDNYGGHINFWSPESWKVFIEKKCSDFGKIITGTFHNNLNNYAIIFKF